MGAGARADELRLGAARCDCTLHRRGAPRPGREDDGDGVHAAFDNPLDAVAATLELQLALADPEATNGIALSVRCGSHLGVVERRGNDFFGTPVNRAARLMAAAHGGQVLLSQAVVSLIFGPSNFSSAIAREVAPLVRTVFLVS